MSTSIPLDGPDQRSDFPFDGNCRVKNMVDLFELLSPVSGLVVMIGVVAGDVVDVVVVVVVFVVVVFVPVLS